MSTFLNKNKFYFLILSIIIISIIIYNYFLIIKPTTIYGDDLYIFTNHLNLNKFSEKINLSIPSGKYRPVHDLMMHLIIESFKKNIELYYFFNIAIQIINTLLFASILNLFLNSYYFSLFFSLIVGLSRFAFFNIAQLFNGGALEGLAMSFFFLSLFFILKILLNHSSAPYQKTKAVFLSILFANLSMYTHERYIVLFPFLLLVTLFVPSLKNLSKKQKISLSVFILASVCLNVLIKKYVYSIPFFVGTGGVNISFSFSNAITFIKEAILSILQINTGPDYLVGKHFFDLPFFYKVLVVLLVLNILLIFVLYIFKLFREKTIKQNSNNTDAFILLFILFGLCLAPAIVTIRLEQRWLQASFSIFIIMIVIAISKIRFNNIVQKMLFASSFILLFLWVDFNYLRLGWKNIYMSYSEKMAAKFKNAIDKGIIHTEATRLFIWQKDININTVNDINWELAEGDFFSFYQQKRKPIIFVDSVYEKFYSSPLNDFNKKNDQILYIDGDIIDITSDYLKDSLKNINANNFLLKIQYNQHNLLINNDNFQDFILSGFYDNENGIRWVNGNASISLKGDFESKDSLTLQLNTYMPPICKNINPNIFLKDNNNAIYQPTFSKRENDKFYFKFYFKQSIFINSINIKSEIIDARPDVRTLSFPFISLEISH